MALRRCPAECIGARKERIEGNPDPKHVSTSYAERQNLTMRMQMRRFTRLTNAFSKKFENHMHMVALYAVWYNYVKQHKSLKGLSPAMAAGISNTLWSVTDLANMVDSAAPKPESAVPTRNRLRLKRTGTNDAHSQDSAGLFDSHACCISWLFRVDAKPGSGPGAASAIVTNHWTGIVYFCTTRPQCEQIYP
jgi:hypothetical protein